MTDTDDDSDDEGPSYVEYTDDDGADAGMIYDADSEDAWIESDTVVSLGIESDEPRAGTRYDADTGIYHIEYDWRDAMPLSMIVVMIVADLEGVDPTDLTPLYDCLDPERLDALFSPRPDGSLAAGRVSFTYHGHEIVVYRHGHIGVRPGAGDTDDVDADA